MIIMIRKIIESFGTKEKKKKKNSPRFLSLGTDRTFIANFQAISGRRERKNKGYTQLSVRVEPPDDVYADDTPELMT